MDVEARFHPMAVAALVRLARSPAWAQLVAQEPLTEPLDRADAELLVAAGVLRSRDGVGYDIAESEVAKMADSPEILARMEVKVLEEALGHTRRTRTGWPDDTHAMLVRGRASGAAAHLLHSTWLDRMPSSGRALRAGPSRFLDVGVGVAAISVRMCAYWPDLTATGIDVSPFALSIAEREIEDAGVAHRIELRQQDVCQMTDHSAFDLAWLPQMYLSWSQFTIALHRVHRALRPDRWVLAPLGAAPETAANFDRALLAHYVRCLGGEPIAAGQAVSLMQETGFLDVTTWGEDQVFIAGRTPDEPSRG